MSTPYHSAFWAAQLAAKGSRGTLGALSRSISNSRVDVNPHQVDAALFAFGNPFARGFILADEVGLGKTIEAGLVLSQHWAERRRKILVIVPASLRKQWQEELLEKFYLPAIVLETKNFNQMKKRGVANPLEQRDQIVITNYEFVARRATEVQHITWDLVVIDEAHRMRNVYKKDNKVAKRVAEATGAARKLLLTATPLQNTLMELYGLVSIVDPGVFGDEPSFRKQFVQASRDDERNQLLRQRLKPLCTRTLRRQVLEYIRFTPRRALTIDFLPSPLEQELYEKVSAFLQRPKIAALPPGQRKLMTMILRKLLASSTMAISGTLEKLVQRMERLTGKPAEDADVDPAEELAGDYDVADETMEEWTEADEGAEPSADIPNLADLNEELAELRAYARLAQSIPKNAKGDALLSGLRQAFDRVESLGGVKKAVIFTESRRTQDFLFNLLNENSYADGVLMLNGTNNDPQSKIVYERWLERYKGKPKITGLKAVDMKAAIVEEFKERASILIATEAAAEGINLQFCSLVVNYDLPWNPQRIEQRIGRCHRYGQACEVVVVNFLNRKNEADRRVFDLLSEKFKLFDGVFGASDGVLGAIESGVDFERRIAEVYQSCRTAAEIKAAFDKLQSELSEQIHDRMNDTRKALLDNFDEEVHQRLKFHHDNAQSALPERDRWLYNLARQELKDGVFEKDTPRFRLANGPFAGEYCSDWRQCELTGDHHFRLGHPLAESLIQIASARKLSPARISMDYAGYGARVAALEPLRGKGGWLEVSRLTVESAETDEFIVVAGCTSDGAALDADICRKLLALPAKLNGLPSAAAPALLPELTQAEAAREIGGVEARSLTHHNEEEAKIERWADDLKASLDAELEDFEAELRELKKLAREAATIPEKLKRQKSVKEKETRLRDLRAKLDERRAQIDGRKDERMEELNARLQHAPRRETLFVMQWDLT